MDTLECQARQLGKIEAKLIIMRASIETNINSLSDSTCDQTTRVILQSQLDKIDDMLSILK